MKRIRIPMFLAIIVIVLVGAAPVAPEAKAKRPRVKTVTLLIGNRAFPDFKDLQTVPMKKDFVIGESRYTGRVVEFVPDFAIDTKRHKVISRSNLPRNPACRIIVRDNGVPSDTSWAFVNFPPHFSRNSLMSFRVVRIDFHNLPPITVEPDTGAAAVKP